MTSIAVIGAGGRMGKYILRCAAQNADATIGDGVDAGVTQGTQVAKNGTTANAQSACDILRLMRPAVLK